MAPYVWTGVLLGLLLQAVGCAGPTATQTEVRVGVLDAQRVLDETAQGQQAKDLLEDFMKNRQALIQMEEKELKRMEESLIKQASVLSANARKEREAKFRRRMLLFQQKAAELNREVQQKQREIFEAFRREVEKAVAQVAQELKLTLVIEKGPGSPTLYSDVSVDITDRVIAEFNRGEK